MENHELALLVEKFKQEFVPGDFLGVLAFIVILAIDMAVLHAHPPGLKRNKMVEKANQLGHVVKAHKVKDYYGVRREDPYINNSLYEYEVDGKKYKYYFFEYATAPHFLDLYWINNPRKAFPDIPKQRKGLSYLALLFPTIVAGLIIAYCRGFLS